MVLRNNLITVLTALIGLAGFSSSVEGQDCIYRDEFGEPIMHVGGDALAGALALLDDDGEMGIPADYNLWDLDANSIPDKVQFTLLTDILCMSGAASHPTVDFNEIRTTFEDNLAQYWNFVNRISAAEAALIAGAPDLRQVGIEVGNAAIAAEIYEDPLPPEVFIGGIMPDAWIGATWQDLRSALKDTGDSINDLVYQGLIGDPSAMVWQVLNNPAVAYILAAVWGLDSTYTAAFFNVEIFVVIDRMLTLQQLDWSYILSVLFPHGLTVVTVANAENSISAFNLDESVLPNADTLAITSNGADALAADVLWGDSTLLDLYNNNGGDVAAIWEEILTQLPGLSVASTAALFVLVAVCLVSGVITLCCRKKLISNIMVK